MISFTEFKKRAQKGNLIPIYQEIPADFDTPVSAFLKIKTGVNDFLLESVEGGERWGRYSFLGTNPKAVFRAKGSQVQISQAKRQTKITTKKDALFELKKYLKDFKPVLGNDLPRFFGGAVGFLSYDMVRYFENLPETAEDDLNVDDMCFLITDTLVVFDNLYQTIKVVANVHVDSTQKLKPLYDQANRKIKALISKLRQPLKVPTRRSSQKKVKLKPSHSEAEFCKLVNKVKKYIRQGDVIQTVISTRFEGAATVAPFDLYRAIRRINPSPYMYYLGFEDATVVGASPEVMVRLEDDTVHVRPIAGTRRRGKNAKDEAKMARELKSDPKEKAEHVMLVDLGRNDLGRVCRMGSVTVDEYEIVERYSHVMHLVSHVSGKLKKSKDAYDVIRATFPAGTLSGAPKVRAMEIIEEMESKKRGIYGGAVGYIGFDGNCDTAITIRTAVFKDKKVYLQAGAGIVYNSIPKREYLECRNKAMGMLKAIESI